MNTNVQPTAAAEWADDNFAGMCMHDRENGDLMLGNSRMKLAETSAMHRHWQRQDCPCLWHSHLETYATSWSRLRQNAQRLRLIS